MQLDSRSWRPVIAVSCLALLVTAAVRLWYGAAPRAIDSLATCSPIPVGLDEDRPLLELEVPARPLSEQRHLVDPTCLRDDAGTDAPRPVEEAVSPPTHVASVAPIESAIKSRMIPSRFWDGVVEFGYPRRTIQLVRNDVSAPPPRPWPVATSLHQSLDQLQEPPSMSWAAHVKHRLQSLTELPTLSSPDAAVLLDELEQLAQQSESLVRQVAEFDEQVQLRRIGYGVQKRLELWRAVWHAEQPAVRQAAENAPHPWRTDRWSGLLQSLTTFLPDHEYGRDWSRFLGVTRLSQLAADADQGREEASEVARFVLRQIQDTELSQDQKEFLRSPPLYRYLNALKELARETLTLADVLRHVEAMESRQGTRYGDALATWRDQMRRSPVLAYRQVAQVLNVHYRNANIRLSMTEEFANRFLPASQHARAPVRESLLGAEVEGRSDSLTHMRVRLVPDPDEIRLKLEANGSLNSQTRSRRGAITMFNNNKSRYIVQKLLSFDADGVRISRTRAAATAFTDLMGVQTDYDRLPLMGTMIRRLARQKHHESQDVTHRALGDRIALRVKQRVDAQLAQQMAAAQQRLGDQVLQPLQQMDLAPEALAMYTTEDRAVLRGRLASGEQLAAFTPRPQALANNLLSVQLHESAVNNFFDKLQLDGRSVELRSLIRDVLDEWDQQSIPVPDDIPAGVELVMWDQHSLAIHCEDDRIRFELTVRELRFERSRWRNFKVIVYYVPVTEAFSCELQRDGIVRIRSLSGKRGISGNDFALKAVFTKVFSKNRTLQLVSPELTADERMCELNIDQLVIDDGWIGLSVGIHPPPRVGQRQEPEAESTMR